MGVLNVSPESFHAGSVHTAGDDLLTVALAMVEAGAALIDVGARSTAPYLDTVTSAEDERGDGGVTQACDVVDHPRAGIECATGRSGTGGIG